MSLPASSTPSSFAATACVCSLLALGLALLVFEQTNGLEDWTFEAQRRQSIRQGRVRAPGVAVGEGSARQWHPWSADALSGRAGSSRIYIVDFIYTRCPGLCEGLGTQFRLMQRELQSQPGQLPISLLSISFDLANDTPEQLAAYAQRHGAQAELWRVTRPADERASQELLRALGIVAIEDGMGGYVHNSALHLIDENGYVRGIYDYGNWSAALQGASSLARQRTLELPVAVNQ